MDEAAGERSEGSCGVHGVSGGSRAVDGILKHQRGGKGGGGGGGGGGWEEEDFIFAIQVDEGRGVVQKF